jgi:hypothetical protein
VSRAFHSRRCRIAGRSSLAVMVVLALALPHRAAAQEWGDPMRPYRVSLTVSAAGYERTEATAEFRINFTLVLDTLGVTTPFNAASLRLEEVDPQGAVLAMSVPFQFDQDSTYDPATHAEGTVILLMTGTTPAQGERYYDLYFDVTGSAYSPPTVTPLVQITDNISDEGLLTFRVQIPGSEFYYHKEGGGFSSWVDLSGQDWIGFHTTPGSGSAGLYRGIPNAVYPEGYFHPGNTSAVSEILWQGPLKATIRSRISSAWECLWEFYPRRARMTMTRVDHSYWFLYEGTPGGSLEPDTDFMVRSDGTQTPLSQSWSGDLPGEEWIYFSDPFSGPAGRSLFVVHEEGDGALDSYYPMEGNMTVFGFGRDGINTYLTGVPKHFTIGLVDGTSFSTVRPKILAAYKPLLVSAGPPEQRPLPAPALVAPAQGAQGVSDPSMFVWRSVEGATTYDLHIATDSLFGAGLVVNDSLLVDTLQSVSGLEQGRRQFWRVRARRQSLVGPFSQVSAFSTAISAPVQVSPPDGATGLPAEVTLRWSGVAAGALSWIQVDTDSLFTLPRVVDDPGRTDSSIVLTGLQTGVRYYWRVAAEKNSFTSPFSTPWSFATTMPGPVLISPAPGAEGQPTAVTFRWHAVAGASSYHLQLATDSTFATGLVKNDSTLADTTRIVVGLAEGTNYFWRVRATTTLGKTLFTPPREFTTGLALPSQVTLVSPAEGATVMPDSVRFSWLPALPSVSRYWFELSADAAFIFSQIDSTAADSLTIVYDLLPERQYWWRVRAGNTAGWGPFSAVRTFVTSVTGLRGEEGLPREFALEQNFPNPFNPETAIRFALPAPAQVRLGVYALTGELIEMLVDGHLEAGNHEVRFAASGVASGVYLCRMEVAGKRFVRKLVLLR